MKIERVRSNGFRLSRARFVASNGERVITMSKRRQLNDVLKNIDLNRASIDSRDTALSYNALPSRRVVVPGVEIIIEITSISNTYHFYASEPDCSDKIKRFCNIDRIDGTVSRHCARTSLVMKPSGFPFSIRYLLFSRHTRLVNFVEETKGFTNRFEIRFYEIIAVSEHGGWTRGEDATGNRILLLLSLLISID